MLTAKINLNNIEEVKRFVQFANSQEFEIELSSGKYTVDAKSIMGIFSLDLSKPITVAASCDNKSEFGEELKAFEAQDS